MSKQVFDEQYTDCNKCEAYWNNQCDGVTVGSERTCTAFKATRRVDIPQEIKSLRERVKSLERHSFILNIIIILYGISNLIDIIFG